MRLDTLAVGYLRRRDSFSPSKSAVGVSCVSCGSMVNRISVIVVYATLKYLVPFLSFDNTGALEELEMINDMMGSTNALIGSLSTS
jgi:hypothetical protein